MTVSFTSGKTKVLCGFAVGCLLFSPPQARAQPGEAGAQGTALRDLKTALPYVNWNSRTHGPLIAITPEKVTWTPAARGGAMSVLLGGDAVTTRAGAPGDDQTDDEAARQQLYAPNEKDTLNADFVARHFRRKLIHLNTLSIFAPPKMRVINTNLKPANPLLGGDLWVNTRRLEATLTPTQWQQLGSATGLGMGDLTPDQQPLLDAILPETMTLQSQAVRDFGNGRVGRQTDPGSERTLTPEQRQDVRLHMERKARFNLVDEKGRGLPMGGDFHSERVGTQTVDLVSETTSASKGKIFGQTVYQDVPNALKPSDLNLKLPLLTDTYVPLTDVKTVEDMLKTVGAKVGLDLRADDRLARLNVYVSTKDRLVHASDLLEGLCWALTATYRKVGPVPGGDPKDFAYVLTYDRAGLAALRGMVGNWQRHGREQSYADSRQLDDAVGKVKPSQYLHYDVSDPLAPTPDALKALHEAQEDQSDTGVYDSSPATVPVSALTAEQRQQMADALKQVDERNGENVSHGFNIPPMTARTDRVALSDSITIAYVVPGVGEIPAHWTFSAPMFAPEFSPDDAARQAVRAANRAKRPTSPAKASPSAITLGRTVVCIAPATVAEAESLFAVAPSLGIGEVWVLAPDSEAGRKLMAACVSVGAAHGVKVGAQVSLVRKAPDDLPKSAASDGALEDRNVFGDTGAQWATQFARLIEGTNQYNGGIDNYNRRVLLAAESPAARTLIAERLRTIATTPGLTALTLRDAAATGRDWAPPRFYGSDWNGSDFGYTIADRLRFLRQNGYDPIDLTSVGFVMMGEADGRLPRFDVDGDEVTSRSFFSQMDMQKPMKDWHDYRAQTERDLLRGVRADLKKSVPDLPVYLPAYEVDTNSRQSGEIRRWTDADAVPFDAVAGSAPIGARQTGVVTVVGAGTVITSASPPSPTVAPAASAADTLYYCPLGTVFASTVRNGVVQAPASPNEASVFDNAATYIRNSLFYAARRPGEGPPAAPTSSLNIVIDMDAMKVADAVTLLRGALPLLKISTEKK